LWDEPVAALLETREKRILDVEMISPGG